MNLFLRKINGSNRIEFVQKVKIGMLKFCVLYILIASFSNIHYWIVYNNAVGNQILAR